MAATRNSHQVSSATVLGWGAIGLLAGVVLVLSGFTSGSRGLELVGAALVVASAIPAAVGAAAVGTRMALREHARDEDDA